MIGTESKSILRSVICGVLPLNTGAMVCSRPQLLRGMYSRGVSSAIVDCGPMILVTCVWREGHRGTVHQVDKPDALE